MERTLKAIQAMPKRKLLAEIKNYDHLINVEDCFGTNDVTYLDMLEREADRRGYDIISDYE